MAEESSQERREKPTPERIKKARQEGQLPQSQEMPSAAALGLLLVALVLAGPSLCDWACLEFRQGITSINSAAPITTDSLMSMFRQRSTAAATASMPFLLALSVGSVLGSVLVGGWVFSPKAIKLDLSRLSPGSGFKNMISFRSGMQLAVTAVKMIVITTVVWSYLHDKLGACMELRHSEPIAILGGIARLSLGALVRIIIAMIAIASLELLYQRWHWYNRLKMSRQEVKEEMRQHELAAPIRQRIRQVQFEMARKRMQQEVPKADVVLANPTHVAVAIKYDSAKMQAPVLLASGADLMSEKIKEIARAHNVPIIYRPELARAIYGTVKVGQSIPETLFVAVAEVLAMVYRLRRKQIGTLA